MFSMQESAIWWSNRFFWPVPAQPGTKWLVKGYGPHQKQVYRADEIKSWFRSNNRINLAVTGYGGGIILDFDDSALYDAWANYHPSEAETYTERTPRGGAHVFFYKKPFTDIPTGLTLKKGVELKNCVMVAPSIVAGKEYARGYGEILEADAVSLFVGLTIPETPTPQLLDNIQRVTRSRVYSIVGKIKQEFPVLSMIRELVPSIEIKGAGRWVTARCPFHDDKNPSFWIDTKRNLYGCHGCSEHGDVINLYGKLKGVPVNQALNDLRERAHL